MGVIGDPSQPHPAVGPCFRRGDEDDVLARTIDRLSMRGKRAGLKPAPTDERWGNWAVVFIWGDVSRYVRLLTRGQMTLLGVGITPPFLRQAQDRPNFLPGRERGEEGEETPIPSTTRRGFLLSQE